MRFTLALVVAFATSIVAQDTVTATQSGVCEPHGDHWHCPSGVAEPSTPPAAAAVTPAPSASVPAPASASASSSHSHDDHEEDHDHDHAASASGASVCEPHGDHWHCPSGVSKPTYLPTPSATTDHDHAVSASTCEPHGDHWHCPSGVSKPTVMPTPSMTTGRSSGTAAGASASPSPSEFPGQAGKVGSGAAVAVLGAVGAMFL